jgi:hypothetical protein
LTASLQLRRHRNPRAAPRTEARSHRSSRATHGLVGASIEGSSVPCFPAVASSPTSRACSLASDVLLHDCPARSGLSARPAPAAAGLRTRDPLVKDDRFAETRTPSLDECPLLRLPLPMSARASTETGSRHHREPATVPANTAVGRLRTPLSLCQAIRGRAPNRRSASSPRCQGRAPSTTSPVDLCNQNSQRAQPRTFRAPTEAAAEAHPACAGLEETSEQG